MRWVLKAAAQKGLSVLPRAESANYVLQRHVTHSLPASEARVRRQFARALHHLAAYHEYGPRRSVGEIVLYELGAGWDLALPLAYWSLGAERQILVDVRPNLRLELLNETLRRLRGLRPALEKRATRALRDPGEAEVESEDELRERFGITYIAPRNARDTGLPAGSVDFVSSTATLEHVREDELAPILAECRRLLRADGVMSSRIDLRDHYSYFDSAVSPYNFLRFGERTWRLFNSPLHYQNRLRRPDYLESFARAGFVVVAEDETRPREHDLAVLRGMRLAPAFRRYSLDELAVKALAVVARPRDSPHAS